MLGPRARYTGWRDSEASSSEFDAICTIGFCVHGTVIFGSVEKNLRIKFVISILQKMFLLCEDNFIAMRK